MSSKRCQTKRIYVLSDDSLDRIARILEGTIAAQITVATAAGEPPPDRSIAAKVDLKALALEALYEIAHQCAVRLPRDLPFKHEEQCFWSYYHDTIEQNLLTEF